MDYARLAKEIAAAADAAVRSGREPLNGVLSIRDHGHERLLGSIEGTPDETALNRELESALKHLVDDEELHFDKIHVGAENSLRTWTYDRRR